jgi:hypothetical protein
MLYLQARKGGTPKAKAVEIPRVWPVVQTNSWRLAAGISCPASSDGCAPKRECKSLEVYSLSRVCPTLVRTRFTSETDKLGQPQTGLKSQSG